MILIDKKRIILDGFIAAACVFLLVLNENGSINNVVSLAVIGIGILSIVRVRNNWMLITIYSIIFYSNYSICMSNYLNRISSYFTGFADSIIGVKGLNLLLLFAFLLYLIAPSTKTKKSNIPLIVNNKNNKVIIIALCVLLAIIWVVGFVRPSNDAERGSPSSVYEYSIILVIMGFYYCGESRFNRSIFIAIAAAYALQNFVYGGRITGIQLIICLALCTMVDKLRFHFVLPFGLVMIIAMSLIGQYRADLQITGNAISSVLDILKTERLALDTAYSAFFTSMTFLATMASTPLSKRLYLFIQWVKSMFLGGHVVDSNLAYYTRQFYVHYNGGVLPYFFFFYLGVVGVLLISFVLYFYFKRMDSISLESNGYWKGLSIYIASTSLRWYLYSPSQLFRGVMLFSLAYFALFYIDKLFSTKSKRIAQVSQRGY